MSEFLLMGKFLLMGRFLLISGWGGAPAPPPQTSALRWAGIRVPLVSDPTNTGAEF